MDVEVKSTERLVTEMKELMEKKTLMESNIKHLIVLLEEEKGVGMDEPLIDAEGFPRGDIDIVAVRHARHDLICLQNDHVHLMREMEDKLHEIHERARIEGKDTVEQLLQAPLAPRRPFLKVRRVEPDSPAQRDGIQVDDVVVQFGRVSCVNYTQELLSSFVSGSINRPITVVVLRHGVEVALTLTPRSWSGRGVLGILKNVIELNAFATTIIMLPQPHLTPPSAADVHLSSFRKRPHYVIEFDGKLLADEIGVQPTEKHLRSEVAINDSLEKLQLSTNAAGENGTTPLLSLVNTAEKIVNTAEDLAQPMQVEDVEMMPLSSVPEDQPSTSSALVETEETKRDEMRIIFKVPLTQLITSPQEQFLKQNPWLKANSTDKALVIWQPSPFDSQPSTSNRNHNGGGFGGAQNEAAAAKARHRLRRRRRGDTSSSSSSSDDSDTTTMSTDDDADSGHVDDSNDIEVDLE